MSRYRPIRTREGAIIQSGLDVRPKSDPLSPMTPRLGLYRALVVSTRVPLLASGAANPDNFRRFQVECDVILVASQIFLRQVPVLQPVYGVNNSQPWIPKPSTRTLSGGQLNFNPVSRRGTFQGPATALGDTDGDHVIVQFVEGQLDFPVITGALTHERTRRIIRAGGGWEEGSGADQRRNPEQDEYYLHHQGAEVRINAAGEVLIDTVGAYEDPETEDASAAGGQVRVRVKDGQRFTVAIGDDQDVLEVHRTGGQLRVDLGEGATERLVLGDSFLTFLNAFLTAVFNAHTHTTGMGPSGPPTPLATAGTDALLSDVARTKKT